MTKKFPRSSGNHNQLIIVREHLEPRLYEAFRLDPVVAIKRASACASVSLAD